jgi:hypothetical protein
LQRELSRLQIPTERISIEARAVVIYPEPARGHALGSQMVLIDGETTHRFIG